MSRHFPNGDDSSNLRYHDFGRGIHIIPVARPSFASKEDLNPHLIETSDFPSISPQRTSPVPEIDGVLSIGSMELTKFMIGSKRWIFKSKPSIETDSQLGWSATHSAKDSKPLRGSPTYKRSGNFSACSSHQSISIPRNREVATALPL